MMRLPLLNRKLLLILAWDNTARSWPSSKSRNCKNIQTRQNLLLSIQTQFSNIIRDREKKFTPSVKTIFKKLSMCCSTIARPKALLKSWNLEISSDSCSTDKLISRTAKRLLDKLNNRQAMWNIRKSQNHLYYWLK